MTIHIAELPPMPPGTYPGDVEESLAKAPRRNR
jgi:hypothetical protein